jgi:hypothetical protein
MDNAYHTMGSLDPSRYNFYALCVDQLDSLFDLVLINLDSNLLFIKDDVLKVNVNVHTIFFFKTYLQ